MHQLYAIPFSCSLAVRLRMAQLGLPVEVHWVARGPARKVSAPGFGAINDRLKVPVLRHADGRTLTEIVSILDALDGTEGRRQRLEWLAFLATEMHQQVLGPVFDPASPPETVDDVLGRLLPPVLGDLERALSGRETLLGGPPDGADAYLFWSLLLLEHRRPALVANAAFRRFQKRMSQDGILRDVLIAERDAFATDPGSSDI